MTKSCCSDTGRMPSGEAINVASLVEYAPESIVSRQLIKNDAGTITLFAFDTGQSLGADHRRPVGAGHRRPDGRHAGGRAPCCQGAGTVQNVVDDAEEQVRGGRRQEKQVAVAMAVAVPSPLLPRRQ